MRNRDTILGGLGWLAVAVMMQMAALEPIAAGPADAPAGYAAASCSAGTPAAGADCGSAHS